MAEIEEGRGEEKNRRGDFLSVEQESVREGELFSSSQRIGGPDLFKEKKRIKVIIGGMCRRRGDIFFEC